MSWIRDIREGIQRLDLSSKNLRKFGLLVGFVFLLIVMWMLWKDRAVQIRPFLGGFGLLLIILGALVPRLLRPVYQVWMGFALAIGWVVSRVLLIFVFVVVMVPIGLVLKILGKRMLDIHPKEKRDSYWILREGKKVLYEKMY